jgi:hypothetical protein
MTRELRFCAEPPVRIELFSAMLVSGLNPVLAASIHHKASHEIPANVLKPCSRRSHGTPTGRRPTSVVLAAESAADIESAACRLLRSVWLASR